MAFKVIQNGANIQSDVVELVVDTLSEVETLPTIYGAGSDALVIENSSVWMLGSDKKWHEL